MKKRVKYFLLFLIVAILAHFIFGYGYIFRGLAFAYFRGQKGPPINEYHLFYNHELPALESIAWNDNNPNLHLSPKDSILLDSIYSAGFIVIKNKE